MPEDPTDPTHSKPSPPIPCIEALDPQAVAFNTFADLWAQANGELLRAAQAAAWNAGVDFGKSVQATEGS
jgi:hypothetical protein